MSESSKGAVPLNDDPDFRITPLQQAAASCTGAILTSLLVTPLDVVKIRLQAQQQNMPKCFLYCNGLMDHLCACNPSDGQNKWFARPGHFTGTADAFYKIAKYEGITSLWSGLSPTLVLAIPATIVYFVCYEQLRLKLKSEYAKTQNISDCHVRQPFWIPLLSGGTARVFSASMVSPLELIRTKMQSQKLSYLQVGQALKNLIQQSGPTGLWMGIFPTLLRDVPFSAIYWMNYETIKNMFNVTQPTFAISFFGGAVAGSIAAFITTPFDVVKTHEQIKLGERVYDGTEAKPHSPMKIIRSTFSTMRKIRSQYGIKGLFAGVMPRVIKVAPSCAIMISTFEYGKVFFHRLAQEKSNSVQRPT